jgi:hypothetical protein
LKTVEELCDKKINAVVTMDLAVGLLGAQILQVWALEGVKETSLILVKALKFGMKRGLLAGWR